MSALYYGNGIYKIAGNSFIFYVNSDQYVLYLSME